MTTWFNNICFYSFITVLKGNIISAIYFVAICDWITHHDWFPSWLEFTLHFFRNVHLKPTSSIVEDMLFYTITEGKEQVPISYFASVSKPITNKYPSDYLPVHLLLLWFNLACLQALKKTGLDPSDPRLKDCMEKLQQALNESIGEVMMDRDLFHRWDSGGEHVVRTESNHW